MDGPVYPEILARPRHRVPYSVTAGPTPRIDQIIFDELVNGIFRSDSLGVISAAISRMKAEGCDAVILGCTELPLLIGNESSPLPVPGFPPACWPVPALRRAIEHAREPYRQQSSPHGHFSPRLQERKACLS